MGGMDALTTDPLEFVRGLYDKGGLFDEEALLSSDVAALCKTLGSKSSRWPEMFSWVVAAAGSPPPPRAVSVSLSFRDGVCKETEARLGTTVATVSVDSEGDVTPGVFGGDVLGEYRDVDGFTWGEDVVALVWVWVGDGEADTDADARDPTGCNFSNGVCGSGETLLL